MVCLTKSLAAVLALMAYSAVAASSPLRIIVTIKPIHSLAAAILDGIAEPRLLIQGAASPHSYALKPSDVEALSRADAIIRVSANLESFLDRAFQAVPAHARRIDLEKTPGLKLLPVRNQGIGGEEGADVHFWLDPMNAIAIADFLDAEFSSLDPEHSAQIHANAEALKVKLAALDLDMKTKLQALSDRPFIVFHDVTQYLEKRYGLHGLGAITLSPERAPGAKRLQAIRHEIENGHATCVFSEPEFPPKLIETLIEGTQARSGVLDEVGAAIPPGPMQYFDLMQANTASLASCLGASENR